MNIDKLSTVLSEATIAPKIIDINDKKVVIKDSENMYYKHNKNKM